MFVSCLSSVLSVLFVVRCSLLVFRFLRLLAVRLMSLLCFVVFVFCLFALRVSFSIVSFVLCV